MPENDEVVEPCTSPARDEDGRFVPRVVIGNDLAVEAEPEEDEESAPACSNCEQPEDDCECVACEGCHEMRSGDEICSNCSQCTEGCCECRVCSACSARRNPNADQYLCSDCNSCEDGCCECSHCQHCGDTVESTCSNCDNGYDCCCRCRTCDNCDERHNRDYHCSNCGNGTGDACGCCGCESDDDDSPIPPAPPAPGNLCPGCSLTLVRDSWEGWKRCALCGQCESCCMADSSECHGYGRGATGNNTRALIQFKEREFKFYDDQTLASKRHTIMVVDRSSVANIPPGEGLSVDNLVSHAEYLFSCAYDEEFVRRNHPEYLEAFRIILAMDNPRQMGASERREKLRAILEEQQAKAVKNPPVMVAIDPNNRHISVELEIDTPGNRTRGRKLHEAVEKWGDSVVEDGSVHSGWEINTSPSSGEAFTRHMRELCDGLDLLELKPSKQCGMHVHINTKDMGFQDLRRLILLYAKIERAIYDACHPYRLTHQYSARCGQYFDGIVKSKRPTDFKGDIHSMLYGVGKAPKGGAPPRSNSSGDRLSADISTGCAAISQNYTEERLIGAVGRDSGVIPAYHALLACGAQLGSREIPASVKAAALRKLSEPPPKKKVKEKHDGILKEFLRKKAEKRPGSMRYRSLNLHSFFYRGSVEFRHHEGSAEFHVIHGWGRLCAEIVTKAVKMSDAQINALPKNPRKAMLEILPPDLKEFIVGEWVKNDAILNAKSFDSREWKRSRENIWGLDSSANSARTSW